MAAVILMVVTVTYPSAILAVVLTALPAIGLGLWTLKCPHCGIRLVGNGASEIEWRRISGWWSEPTGCKRCGNEF